MLRLRIRGQGYLSLLPKGTVGPGPFGLGLSKDVFTGGLSAVCRGLGTLWSGSHRGLT